MAGRRVGGARTSRRGTGTVTVVVAVAVAGG